MKNKFSLEESQYQDMKRDAVRHFIRYFRIWFVIVGLLLVALIVAVVRRQIMDNVPRGNLSAPTERVYDYADLLTFEEEEQLRKLIAKREKQIRADIVIVTIAEDMGTNDRKNEIATRDFADDFYDENGFGYQKVHGDGILLLDNSMKGQERITLSTCGAVLKQFGNAEIERVLDSIFRYERNNPYRRYRAYIESTYREMTGKRIGNMWMILIIVLPVIVLLIFVGTNLKSPLGREKISHNAYVEGGKPVMNAKSDNFNRKSVTSRRIPKNEGGGGGGGSSGGGGARISSSGVSHGGGSRKG